MQHINPTRAQNLTFRPQIQSASHQVTVFFTKNKKIIDICFYSGRGYKSTPSELIMDSSFWLETL